MAKLNSVGDSALSRVTVEQDVGENNPNNENQPTQTKLIDVVNDDIQFEQKTLAKLLKPLGGNEVFFRRLLAVFENNFAKQMTTLSNHVERRERSEVAAMLHTFKGSTGTIGLTTLYQVVCKMETLFMQKQSVSDSEFDKLCEGLTACLNSIAAEELAMVHTLLAAQQPAPFKPELTPTKAVTTDLSLMLAPLKPLLQAGDLKALTLAREFAAACAADKQLVNKTQPLFAAIENLAFGMALDELAKLSENTET